MSNKAKHEAEAEAMETKAPEATETEAQKSFASVVPVEPPGQTAAEIDHGTVADDLEPSAVPDHLADTFHAINTRIQRAGELSLILARLLHVLQGVGVDVEHVVHGREVRE